MTFELYDLAGYRDDLRFSPFCWRVRMALAHQGADVVTIPWRGVEKDRIAFSGQALVPVLVAGATHVSDSWRIAEFLDETAPDAPRLFDSEQAKALSLLVKHWVEQKIHPLIFKTFLPDQLASLHPMDRETFRAVRENRFGTRLENLVLPREEGRAALRDALSPARGALERSAYLAGTAPAFADYILFGALQWQRVISPDELLDPADPVFLWRDRMLGLFGGLAGAAPRRVAS